MTVVAAIGLTIDRFLICRSRGGRRIKDDVRRRQTKMAVYIITTLTKVEKARGGAIP
jgi:hypothetical protein